MSDWKKFEKNVEAYLNDKIKIGGVAFKSKGESDSHASDVEVYLNGNLKFSIECKFVPAQSSQFVVKQDGNKFVYSEDNKSSENGTSKIIKHMNDNFEYYACDSSSIKLTCGQDLMYARIVEQLKVKSKFFATSSSVDCFSNATPLAIDLIEELPKYFDVSGVYRNKRSGTSYARLSQLRNFPNAQKRGDKFYIYDPDNKLPKYPANDPLIFLPEADNSGYRVLKRRSGTNNKNVIFTLKLKSGVKHSKLDLLTEYIKSLAIE